MIYAALFDGEGHRVAYGTERRYWPIVPKLVCRAYDGPAVDEAVRKRRAEADGGQRPYPDFAALGLKPVLTFPLGRLTFQPSQEGVYFTSTYLVMEGRIKIPADGDYQFFADGGAEVHIDGQSAAVGAVAKTRKKAAGQANPESRKLHLTAGVIAWPSTPILATRGNRSPGIKAPAWTSPNRSTTCSCRWRIRATD